MEKFIVRKKSETVATSSEYTMEVIETNFIEDLKLKAKDKQYEELKLYKI